MRYLDFYQAYCEKDNEKLKYYIENEASIIPMLISTAEFFIKEEFAKENNFTLPECCYVFGSKDYFTLKKQDGSEVKCNIRLVPNLDFSELLEWSENEDVRFVFSIRSKKLYRLRRDRSLIWKYLNITDTIEEVLNYLEKELNKTK